MKVLRIFCPSQKRLNDRTRLDRESNFQESDDWPGVSRFCGGKPIGAPYPSFRSVRVNLSSLGSNKASHVFDADNYSVEFKFLQLRHWILL
jgi:hypothetical protein